jgi:hypothetical protein
MSTVFFCKLCEKSWTTLPEGSVQLTHGKRGGDGHANTYRFADGSIHVIKKAQSDDKEQQ